MGDKQIATLISHGLSHNGPSACAMEELDLANNKFGDESAHAFEVWLIEMVKIF